MLSEIYPGNSPKTGSSYWDQIQEVALISVTRRVLQRFHGLVEQVYLWFHIMLGFEYPLYFSVCI